MIFCPVSSSGWFEQANLCFVDIDNHCVEAPEDLPVFPDQTELIQELSEVLLRFGLSPRGAAHTHTKPDGAASPQLSSLVLEDLMEDRRNGNLGGEELAVLERLQALALRCGGRKVSEEGKTLHRALEEEEEEELKAARLNVQLREVFAGRFAAMFNRYEEFVIHSALDLDSWLNNREGTSSFDKVLEGLAEIFFTFMKIMLMQICFLVFLIPFQVIKISIYISWCLVCFRVPSSQCSRTHTCTSCLGSWRPPCSRLLWMAS